MKIVLSPDMVAHKFAHQLQSQARNSGNTFFFDCESIFSYGRHFCIAKHVKNEQGVEALLFTTRGYSNTTAKHKSIVRNATNHLNLIYCNDPSDGRTLNMEAFEKEMKGALVGLANARKPEKYINEAECILERVKKYAEFFGMEVPTHLIELIDSAKTGKYAEYLKNEAVRIEAERKEKELKRIKEFKKQIAKWRKGEGQRLYDRFYGVDYLRAIGQRIETSQGIEIPYETGKRAFKIILALIAKGGCLGECNFKILDFEVKEVNKDFIVVGCHKIEMTEVKKIAKQMNWIG